MSIIILEPVCSDHFIANQRKSNSHILHVRQALLILKKFILSPKWQIPLCRVANKVEIWLVTETNEVQEIRIVFDLMADCLSKSTSFSSILDYMSLNKRLVGFFGESSRHCLNVTIRFLVLKDRDWPLWPVM